ncbi:Hsp70 family protein [Vulgatibacter incomptus]|uniref:DnaK-related protein n=1 Tax=Vulgatibacter incomptus TaxID=1391653 RepID=A0A0K1PCZ9_9BACT|nr:Hsp70 family protein [Vulgatibacter incomptus]AKU91418.1 DnaK-related protein [Vulgatibacter incomptus]
MASPTYVIGIDLGTTNVGLAGAPAEGDSVPAVFPLPQVVHSGEVSDRDLLPSFLYVPGEVELPAGAIALPWASDRDFVVGSFARDQGARVPARLVSSAKSWLSHAGVDRHAAILPWGSPDEVRKVSPVEASARYLGHVREAWNAAHPESPLEEQELVLTVPASFDAVARELTVEAAHAAGLGERLTLLEEPQAALYAWVSASGEGWRKQVQVGDLILVCDIGGGTVDFSLIAVLEEEGNLQLSRVAVGDHILLGGDNMDLALAHTVKARLEAEGKSLDDWQLRALTHGCRVAKEGLFADPSLGAMPVVIPGRGSKLVGGAIRSELSRAELDATLVDGFFPRVASDARPQLPRRLGLTALGLPFAHDPGVTRHLAAFLGRQLGAAVVLPEGVHAEGRSFLHPTAVLFNGGVTKAPLLRDRIVEVLDGWIAAEGGRKVTVLEGADPDLAVCRGAAYYGRVRRGLGVRIRGGTARSYYVGMERAELAVPGIPPRIDAICVAPFGMEEGSETTLPGTLGLVVGEPAAFRFFASSTRREDPIGAMIEPTGLDELAPIETTLQGEQGQIVPVRLHAKVTEVGTLELSAEEEASGRRWKLEYDVRGE